MNGVKLMKNGWVVFALLAAVVPQSVFAEFVLIDKFDYKMDGSINGQNGWYANDNNLQIADAPPGGSGKVLNNGFSTTTKHAMKTFEKPVVDGAACTAYWEFYCTNKYCNTSMGLANGNDGSIWNNFRTQIALDASGTFVVRNGGGFVTLDQSGSIETQTWYKIWVVADNSNNVYQAYIKGGVFTEQTQLTSGSGATTIFGFRSSETGWETSDLSNFNFVRANGTQPDLVIDNLYIDYGSTNLNEIASEGEVLARWSFADQGLGGTADLTMSDRHPYIKKDLIVPGSGIATITYDAKGRLVQTNSIDGGYSTYIDATGTNAVDSTGKDIYSKNTFWYVGDWDDGSAGGGDVSSNTNGVFSPVGNTYSGTGAYFNQVSPMHRNSIAEVISYNLGLKFSLYSSDGVFDITSISFHSVKNMSNPDRTWESWYLLADLDENGFSESDVVTSGLILDDDQWSYNEAFIPGLTLPKGKTVDFMLLGINSVDNTIWAREMAVDDITIRGELIEDQPALARWSFEDQGFSADADLSATASHDNISASDIAGNTGYTTGLLVQTNAAGSFTYVDSTGTKAMTASGEVPGTLNEFLMVGDWDDGLPTGGNIVGARNDTETQDFTVNPNGFTVSDGGALYVNASANIMRTLQDALDSNLGLKFNLTADGEYFSITNFSFYLARDSDNTDRSWEQWYLLASDDDSFSASEVIASGDTQTSNTETWVKHQADLNMKLKDGETKYFLLIGETTENIIYGRETAFDDITFEGTTYVPMLGTVILVQ